MELNIPTCSITPKMLADAEGIDASANAIAEAYFKATGQIQTFAGNTVLPLLKGQLNLNAKEAALIGTYFRMYAWMRTMVAMNSNVCFQATAAAARSLVELRFDIELLSRDATGKEVRKFREFPEVDKFKAARKIVKFADMNPNECGLDVQVQRELVGRPGIEQVIERVLREVWGRGRKENGDLNFPDHWTGMKIRERARSLGPEFEEAYLEAFTYASWHVHSGATAYMGKSEEALIAVFGYSHIVAQKSFLDGTLVVCREMKILEGVESLKAYVDSLRRKPAEYLVQEKLKILETLKDG